MEKFIVFTDKAGVERIFHSRYPIFMARVIGYYDQHNGPTSKSFDLSDQRLKIAVDESYQDTPESKISWALGRAISFYKNWKKSNDHNQ